MTKPPFRLSPYQVQFLLVIGFITIGYALYLRYLAIEFSTVALACDGFVRLFSNDNPLLRLARGAGIGLVNRVGPLRRLMMGEAGGAVGDLPRLLRGEAL